MFYNNFHLELHVIMLDLKFLFKMLIQKRNNFYLYSHAWFDISNPNAKVPIVNDTVFVKLLLLSDVTYSRIAKKMVECLLQTSSPIGDLQI